MQSYLAVRAKELLKEVGGGLGGLWVTLLPLLHAIVESLVQLGLHLLGLLLALLAGSHFALVFGCGAVRSPMHASRGKGHARLAQIEIRECVHTHEVCVRHEHVLLGSKWANTNVVGAAVAWKLPSRQCPVFLVRNE